MLECQNLHKCVTFFPSHSCRLLSHLNIVSQHINLLSHPTWGVNNIPALSLHSLFCTHVQNTNNFLLERHRGILFPATGRSPKFFDDIARCNISYQLIYCSLLNSPHVHTLKEIPIKELQWCALFSQTEERITSFQLNKTSRFWMNLSKISILSFSISSLGGTDKQHQSGCNVSRALQCTATFYCMGSSSKNRGGAGADSNLTFIKLIIVNVNFSFHGGTINNSACSLDVCFVIKLCVATLLTEESFCLWSFC